MVWTNLSSSRKKKYMTPSASLFTIPTILLKVPAAVRFVSMEPLLGRIQTGGYHKGCEKALDWMIAGPETGPGKRECDPAWIQEIYEDCRFMGTPFFDKRDNFLAREWPKGESE